MGFFTKPTDLPAPDAPVLAPLSKERVQAALESNEIRYGVDDDGDIGAYFDTHPFYFFCLGESFLQIRGRWNREAPVSELDALLRAANEWNTDKLWPKLYVRQENGGVSVYAEHSVDYAPGVTDEQINAHIRCALVTSLDFFENLDGAYPELAAAAKAKYEHS